MVWNPDLHPRGRDGKFIKKWSWVRLTGWLAGHDKLRGERGQVVDVTPDPTQPGNPIITVDLGGGTLVKARPSQIIEAKRSKARIRWPWTKKQKVVQLPKPPSRAEQLAAFNKDIAQLDTQDFNRRHAQLEDLYRKFWPGLFSTSSLYARGGTSQSGWSPERTAQHEEMWDDLIAQVEAAGVPQDRHIFALGGLPGSGKTYSMRKGEKGGERFGVVAWTPGEPIPEGVTHVNVSPDEVKQMMIDRGMLTPGIDPRLKPNEQIALLHEESRFLSNLFTQRLSDAGYNLVRDETMDSDRGMDRRYVPFAEKGYDFQGLFVDIPLQESADSTFARYLETAGTPQGGRFIPKGQSSKPSWRGNYSRNRDNFDDLIRDDWFTDYAVLDNTGVGERKPINEFVVEGTGEGSTPREIHDWTAVDAAHILRVLNSPPRRKWRPPTQPPLFPPSSMIEDWPWDEPEPDLDVLAERKADRLYHAAVAAEPAMTELLQQMAAEYEAELAGLEFRLKERDSLVRKIKANGLDFEIPDALRYTMVVPDERYGDAARASLAELERNGWIITTKNYWKPGDAYQGINTILRKGGVTMEIQYHTPASKASQKVIWPLYEKFRVSKDNTERRRLYEEMVAITNQIPVPPNITGLPNETWAMKPYEDLPPIESQLLPEDALSPAPVVVV